MNDILDNYKKVQQAIKITQAKSQQVAKEVLCLCVSKKKPAGDMQILIDSQPDTKISFGENYVQEAILKTKELKGNYYLHLIGPLQSNKVSKAVAIFEVIQTIDSLKLASLVDGSAKKLNKTIAVFIQVNISADDQKRGLTPEDLFTMWSEFKKLDNLNILGIMTITKFYENPESARPDFIKLRELRDKLCAEKNAGQLLLSMGMSQDFEIAIEEGADIVRIGSAIFGER